MKEQQTSQRPTLCQVVFQSFAAALQFCGGITIAQQCCKLPATKTLDKWFSVLVQTLLPSACHDYILCCKALKAA
jgi:hypothetical protein